LAPYPTIEIFSGTFGGMSGGAVLDTNGHVVGITSRGVNDWTLAAWWMQMLFGRAELTWPSGVDNAGEPLWKMPTVDIVGREHVRVLDEPNFELNRWT
jgi:hypothetical protein